MAEEKKHRCVVMIGCPYCGKSTLAMSLKESMENPLVLQWDSIVFKEFSIKELGKTMALRSNRKTDGDVVIDSINFRRQLDIFLRLQRGKEVELVLFDVPFSTIVNHMKNTRRRIKQFSRRLNFIMKRYNQIQKLIEYAKRLGLKTTIIDDKGEINDGK